jgi:hypothetical protein
METTLDLSQFTGTSAYHRTFMFNPKLVHTDGVQYFAETAGCYWFLDIVATDIFALTKKEPFLSIVLQVKNGSANIFIENGDCEVLETRTIEHTDCPAGEYSFFLIDNVLMLTSEY